MSVSAGVFGIIQRGQLAAGAFARPKGAQAQVTAAAKSADATAANPASWTFKRNESAVDAYWRLAPDNAARAKAITPQTTQALQKLADGGNRDISAEKLRQAKAKLEALRRQLQMLAASGDAQQLRRIAAEAARLAREIGGAARDLAQGIGAGQPANENAGAQATASSANAAAVNAQDAPAGESSGQAAEPAGATVASTPAAATAAPGNQSLKELREVTNDARNAIVQAKGIISLAAQLARAKRRGGADDEDDRFFRDLQQSADAALSEVDAGERDALNALLDGGAGDAVLGTTTVETTVTTTIVAFQAEVDVYA